MNYSIVIPCYNEAENLPLIMKKFNKIFIKNNFKFELILVNNGSTDNSKLVLKEHVCKYAFIKVVEIEKNEGYGNGIVKGLQMANGDFIGWMHADMQTSPEEVIKAMQYTKENSDTVFIKGKRCNRPFLDTFFTVGMTIFESLYLNTILFDINAQPTFFHRNFFALWENPPKDFSLDLYAYYLAKKNKMNVIRFPVQQKERIYGVSSWNNGIFSRINLIKRTLFYSKNLKGNLKNEK